MALRTRIDPLQADIAVILQEDLSPQAQSRALAGFARDQLVEAQQINRSALGSVPGHRSYVDGRQSDNLDAVKPSGVIVFEFDLLSGMFEWIDLQLITHSPVRSGRYRRSHILLADGVEVDPAGRSLDVDEYVYLNAQPYARKIERGLSKQAPDGVYQGIATLASGRFGNLARISFGYRGLHGGDRLNRQPAIVIRVR